MSSKISTLILLLGAQRLRVLPSWFGVFTESEINRSLAASLHGKPHAIHSQSIISEITEGINIDSSEAR